MTPSVLYQPVRVRPGPWWGAESCTIHLDLSEDLQHQGFGDASLGRSNGRRDLLVPGVELLQALP